MRWPKGFGKHKFGLRPDSRGTIDALVDQT
jgi:hypothetical protein